MKLSRRRILNWILPATISYFFSEKLKANEKNNNLRSDKNIQQNLGVINSLENDPHGYRFVGGFFSAEGKAIAGLKGESLHSRLQKRGQFDVETLPNQSPGIAGIVFGGDENRIAIIGDQRGRLQVYSSINGLSTAQQISIPVIEGTGVFYGPYQDRIVKFPCAGSEDDNLSPGLWLSTAENGTPSMYLVSPLRYTAFDNPYPGNKNVNQLQVLLSNQFIPELLEQVKYSSEWNLSSCWIKIFSINYSDKNEGSISGFFCLGSNKSSSNIKYSIDIANLEYHIVNEDKIEKIISIIGLKDMSTYEWEKDNLTQFGFTIDEEEKKLVLYAKIPPRGEGGTFIPIRINNEKSIEIFKSDAIQNKEPMGIRYISISYILESRNTIKMNDGSLKFSPGTVLRISLSEPRHINDDGFVRNDDYSFIHKEKYVKGRITVNKIDNNSLKIIGAVPNEEYWSVYPPIDKHRGESTHSIQIVDVNDSSFIIEIKEKNTIYEPVTMTQLPKDSWIDLHLSTRVNR